MSGIQSEVTEWCKRAMAIVDGVELDYFAIGVAEGKRSWPTHATVRVDGRSQEAVLEELLQHVSDIGATASANGRAGFKIRLLAYRSKMAAGSRTFASAQVAGSDSEEEGDGTARGESVQTIVELRRIVIQQSETLAIYGGKGWELGLRATAQVGALQLELATLRAELAAAQKDTLPDPLRIAGAQLLQAVAPEVIGPFLQFAMARLTAEPAPPPPPPPPPPPDQSIPSL